MENCEYIEIKKEDVTPELWQKIITILDCDYLEFNAVEIRIDAHYCHYINYKWNKDSTPT